ncbi:uncharacterized protein LOC128199334 isoform X2 [Bicyclus anynana]|uniref:Uncharacterized protein LOC128199334 isoform X2 n=1 Tax=Bicyclus anynana TaxID=110368 RepID=A0ABM3LZB6_BICAN|nr:uncharacterized protein LOC128199334 isoform X2 [Bicyclus anynana]
MVWLECTFVEVCLVLLFGVARNADCFHVVPASFPETEMDPLKSGQKAFGLMIPPFAADDDTSVGYQSKAFGCSLTPCLQLEEAGAVCACNFNTGNVVTFKNSCDVKKHNCRFDTAFKVILDEICPWEFESRRSNKQLFEVDYSDPKYYNK